ncbi:hypothetical protein DD595_25105, partial [Enterobacter cloacae complex sp. 4DZ3-17B2]
LIPIDLEINVASRRRNQERIRNILQDLEAAAILEEEPQSSEASSSFRIAEHSRLDPSEDYIMAEEPRRVLWKIIQVLMCHSFSPALHNQKFKHKLLLIHHH